MVTRRNLAPVFLVAALLGCSAGGPLEAPGPREGNSDGLQAADGTTLAVSRWPAARPEAVLIAVHGYGDYGPSTFARAAQYWADAGITTIAYDQRGFGRNQSRGYWPGAEALVNDLRGVVGQVRAQQRCLPVMVLGHSMGGGVALAAAPDLEVDGLILAAPAIWGGTEFNPLHRIAAWTAASLVPERRFTGEGVVKIQASDNIDMLRGLGRDPLYLRPPSAREIWGLVRVTDLAATASARVQQPSLLLLGAKDQILPQAAVLRVYDRLSGPGEEIIYEDGWHLLFRDLQAERVWRDVRDWVRARPDGKPCAS